MLNKPNGLRNQHHQLSRQRYCVQAVSFKWRLNQGVTRTGTPRPYRERGRVKVDSTAPPIVPTLTFILSPCFKGEATKTACNVRISHLGIPLAALSRLPPNARGLAHEISISDHLCRILQR